MKFFAAFAGVIAALAITGALWELIKENKKDEK